MDTGSFGVINMLSSSCRSWDEYLFWELFRKNNKGISYIMVEMEKSPY